MKSTIVGETKRCGRRDAAVSFSSDRRRSNSVVTLTQCSKELLNDAVSDTTDDDGSSERWLHNPQLHFKELT
ncbi:MAG TPA: hypothetical protein VL095_07445 [Flavisolibacter sp.]|nr:hypothetical protein [Flavisolibacter sp.]